MTREGILQSTDVLPNGNTVIEAIHHTPFYVEWYLNENVHLYLDSNLDILLTEMILNC